MKIIGKAASNRFIVEMTEYEIANVAGFDYPSEMKDRNKPDVGSEVQVSKLFAALSVERKRRAEIEGLAASLRKVADRVDSINAALDCPIVEPQS